eukprot:431438_1
MDRIDRIPIIRSLSIYFVYTCFIFTLENSVNMVSFLFLYMIIYRVTSVPITIRNAGFEDDTMQNGDPIPDNTFIYCTPRHWSLYTTSLPTHQLYDHIGVVNPRNSEYFVNGTPDPILEVWIWLHSDDGEAGTYQELNDTVTADTRYTLSVLVGNAASATASSQSDTPNLYNDLSGFPGFRIDLFACDSVLGSINDSQIESIPDEGYWANVTLVVNVSSDNTHIGQKLAIRLVNTMQQSSDNSVDFDAVHLDATYITTKSPTHRPSLAPTNYPTTLPSQNPTLIPTTAPTNYPTTFPSKNPTNRLSLAPTTQPTTIPSQNPTLIPTNQPTRDPKVQSSQPHTDAPSAEWRQRMVTLETTELIKTLDTGNTREKNESIASHVLIVCSSVMALIVFCLIVVKVIKDKRSKATVHHVDNMKMEIDDDPNSVDMADTKGATSKDLWNDHNATRENACSIEFKANVRAMAMSLAEIPSELLVTNHGGESTTKGDTTKRESKAFEEIEGAQDDVKQAIKTWGNTGEGPQDDKTIETEYTREGPHDVNQALPHVETPQFTNGSATNIKTDDGTV